MLNKTIYKSLFLIIAILFLIGCSGRVRGNGNVTTETREASGFDKVHLLTSADIILTQDDTYTLSIEGEENILAEIETSVNGNTLDVSTRPNVIIEPTEPLVIRLSMPNIDEISVTGSGSLMANELAVNSLVVSVAGSGDVEIDTIEAETLDVRITGSGNVELAGETESQDVLVSGSGEFMGDGLFSETAVVSVTGSGQATVWAIRSLDADITGSGDIDYFGDPQVDQTVVGSGEITQRSGR
ncbi:MAG: head GIN domain-containing protein [Chloroflexota bacterium]